MGEIRVDLGLCTGCGVCVDLCPFGAIEIDEGKAVIGDTCNLCGGCIESCSFEALAQKLKEEAAAPESSGVWVFAEQIDGEIAPVVFELLGQGQKLAKARDAKLAAVLFGSGLTEKAEELFAFGADLVYLLDNPKAQAYGDELYALTLAELVAKEKPEILLLGGTTIGRSLAPRVAARLQTGLTADCTGLEIDPERGILMQTRPAFGGNIMATIVCPSHRPQMATVRPKVFQSAQKDPNRSGEVITVDLPSFTPRSKLLESVRESAENVNLQDAEIIVAGGRGLMDQKGFELLSELARLLGGVVGATRAAVDAGWIAYPHQIGQTGKTVAPKLYLACGISGAVQHAVGMQSAERIIAINKNPDAPIFQIAHVGIVGDVFEVLPALIAELK